MRKRKRRGRGDAERGGMGWDWLGFQAGAGSWLNASGSGWRASGLIASPSAFLPRFGEGSKATTPARGRQQGHGPDPAGTPQYLGRACWCGQDTGPIPQRSPCVPGVAPELCFPKGEVKEGFSGLSKNHQIWVGGVPLSPLQGKPFLPISGASHLGHLPELPARASPTALRTHGSQLPSWRPIELMAVGASCEILNRNVFNHRYCKKKPGKGLYTLEGNCKRTPKTCWVFLRILKPPPVIWGPWCALGFGQADPTSSRISAPAFHAVSSCLSTFLCRSAGSPCPKTFVFHLGTKR